MLFGPAWRKAIPLSVLFFSATFIFTMLQSLKDGIVVIEMGADALPFLTTLGTLPASLAYFNFYRFTLVPLVPPRHLYIATAAPFLAFYALFAFVLYPLAPALHGCSAQWLSWLAVLPQGLAGLVAAVQKWLFSLFYVAGDLWGPVMITLAFWTVADEVCTMEEAKVLYPQLGLLANLGLVGSGKFIKAVYRAVGGRSGPDGMGAVLQVLVLCMLLMAGVMFACKALINRRYLKPGRLSTDYRNKQHSSTPHTELQPAAAAAAAGNKPKASWQEARAVLDRNPKAAELTTWVVSFGVALRLFEYAFKAQLRLAAADSAAYCCALADLQSAIGLGTLVLMTSSKLIFKQLLQQQQHQQLQLQLQLQA
ncbi:ADP/ATP carrier protein [Scenedesmus sp. NREL 46B-D3]|nr:ADP/ATP carrier protein [Scenedesmus sp. NREL 46B-D3]